MNISIKKYTKDHQLFESIVIVGRHASYNGRQVTLSEKDGRSLAQIVEECKMHKYEANDRYGDSDQPQSYMKLELDTRTGHKKIHVEPSNPLILNIFADRVKEVIVQSRT